MQGQKKNIPLLLCILLSGVFVLLFSYSTSPLYPYTVFTSNDSSQFLTMGRAWYFGKIPYRDMFDHKGPFIFFVDMLGYALTGGKSQNGVALFQFIFMCFTTMSFYMISQIGKKDVKLGVIAVILSLILIRNNTLEGNYVEEYCLPFLGWSTYFALSFLHSPMEKHDFKKTFLYGFTLGICFLTRITNFAPVSFFILAIVIHVIRNKQFKNLLENAFSFILGSLAAVLPFCIYFYQKGCLSDMFYASFTFNVEYATTLQSWLFSPDKKSLIVIANVYFLSYIILLAAVFAGVRKNYTFLILYICTWLFEVYIYTSGSLFRQYPLVCAAQVSIVIYELSLISLDKKKLRTFAALLITAAAIATTGTNLLGIYQRLSQNSSFSGFEWDSLVAEIPQEDTDSFSIYGGFDLKGAYLSTGLLPCYKYFVLQDWHGSFSPTIRTDIYETYNTCAAKWLLTDDNTEIIRPILDANYTAFSTSGKYTLYRRK